MTESDVERRIAAARRVLQETDFERPYVMPDEKAERMGTWFMLPDKVADQKRPGEYARGYVKGFEKGIETVALTREQYPDRSLIECLLKAERDLTDQLDDIDHSGRGSGCCQAEAGLQKQREAVRWLLFGEWDLTF